MESNQTLAKRMIRDVTAGSVSGIIAKTCIAPIERARTLMQIDGIGMMDSLNYVFVKPFTQKKNFRELMKSVYGLFQGNLSLMIRIVPANGIYFGSYFLMKDYWVEKINFCYPYQNILLATIAGAATGSCISTTLTYPLDTLHTRTMHSKGFTEAIKGGKLFSGYSMAMAYVVPYACLSMSVYELGKYFAPPDKPQNIFTIGAISGLTTHLLLYPFETLKKIRQNGVDTKMRIFLRSGTGIINLYSGAKFILLRTPINNGITMLTLEYIKKTFDEYFR
jgi:hypothetical protein